MAKTNGLASTANIPPGMALVASHRMATLRELETWYSCGDLLDMIEVLEVAQYNDWCILEDLKHE